MLLIALGRSAQFFLLFATLKVATTLLSPAEMARVFLVSSIVAFYAMLLLNPVGMFMNRRLHAWNVTGKVQRYYSYFWLYLLVVCGIAVVSSSLVADAGWIGIHTSKDWLVLLVGGSLLFSTVNQVVIPGLNMLGHRGWFIALTLATAAIGLAAAVLLVNEFTASAEPWICGLLIGQLVAAVVGWKVFFGKLTVKDSPQKQTKAHVEVLFGFAWPISIAVGLGWIQSQGYRFMMESTLGLTELGLFAAGYGISAGIISAFESVFATYFQPMFYKKISNGDVNEQGGAWSEYAGAIFPSLILIGLLVIAAAPEFTRVMLGPEFQSSSQFIVWGAIAELARVASGVYGMVAHARMKTSLLLLPGLIGAPLAIFLIWWLMPVLGSTGVGIALVLSSTTSFILTIVSTRNEFEVKLPHKTFAMGLIMGCGLLMLAEIVHWQTSENAGLLATMIRLSILGCAFLSFQYVLLRPLLYGHRIHEESSK
ncbi:lipopolysaccharide biosynthesis protein [Pseudomonadota bacterium]